MVKRAIAFTGPKSCGKDTAAKCLFRYNTGDRRNYFRKAMFAEGVKNMGSDYFGWTPEQMDDFTFKETPIPLWEGGPVIEPRWFMMDEANGLRERYHRAIHAYRWLRHCHLNDQVWGAHVATDLRFPDEEPPVIRMAEKSLIIYIERDEAEERLAKAQAAGEAKALNPSEAHYTRLKKMADIVIPNNGEIYLLNNAVVAAVRAHFGHWSEWGVPRQAHQITNQEIAEEMYRG